MEESKILMVNDSSKESILADALMFSAENHSEEFANYHNDTIKKRNIQIGLLCIAGDLYSCVSVTFLFLTSPWYDYFIKYLSLVISIITLIIFIKTKINQKINKIATIVKFFFVIKGLCDIIFLLYTEPNEVMRKERFISKFYLYSFLFILIYINLYQNPLILPILLQFSLLSVCIGGNLTFSDKSTMPLDIMVCFSFYLFYFYKNSSYELLQKSFNEYKKNKIISGYFNSLINNLNIQVVTFKNKQIVYSNLLFRNSLDTLKSSDELNYISYFKSLIFNQNEPSLNDSIFSMHNHKGETLYDSFNRINNMQKDCNSQFNLIGEFTNNDKTHFYNISIRKIKIENDVFMDILIDDFTKIKVAEALSLETKIKQKLFSKFAHEFKTPVLVLKSLATDFIEKNKGKSDESLKLSNKISNISDYIAFLINDIIYYTNQQEMNVQCEYTNSIKDIIVFSSQICESLISVLPGKRNVAVDYYIDQKVENYLVYTDIIRLKQVLLNFISNSAKFTKEGKIEFRSYIINEEDPKNDSLIISIKDTGIGMSQKQINNLLDNNDKLKLEIRKGYNEMGSGLGVGIAKSILSKLNHEIIINSEEDKGTEIIIKINNLEYIYKSEVIEKLNESSLSDLNENSKYINSDNDQTTKLSRISFNLNYNDRDQEHFSSSKSKFVVKVSNKSLKDKKDAIILVDDSIHLLNALANVVRSTMNKLNKNYDIILGNDGIDILKYIKEGSETNSNQIKLIITDEMMEYMCGSKALSVLVDLEKNKKIKKIFKVCLTAFSDEETKDFLIKQGADLVLEKPIKEEGIMKIFEMMGKL